MNKMKLKKFIIKFVICILILIFLCEILIPFLFLFKCNWPSQKSTTIIDDNGQPVNTLIIADVHLSGPHNSYWIDKIRRDWQMYINFQLVLLIYRPDIVFILGDIFDEGLRINDEEFDEHVSRFRKIFHMPKNIRLVTAVGNHDIGFHYEIQPFLIHRANSAFNSSGVDLISIRGVNFVVVNSVAMEGDGCNFCTDAKRRLNKISYKLKCAEGIFKCKEKELEKYSRPVLMQHYPTYRTSDKQCLERDSSIIEEYREKLEVLSMNATDIIGNSIKPRVAFSGHSHYYCKIINRLNIEEYTISTFNLRMCDKPSFFLVKFTTNEHNVRKCDIITDTITITIYFIGIIITIFISVLVRIVK